ncbi:MAG TPA: hypothetical protein VMS37_34855 [Verrucomicrobiae bacterium]|nr:hypothetical protein [Verrucomicrobiae bacterium]
MRGRTIFGLAILVCCSFTARAGLVYDNGQPPVSDGIANCFGGCPDLTEITGEGLFSLVSNTVLTSATFWTFQLDGVYQGGTLAWHIFADNGGSHGSLLGSGTFTLTQTLIQPVTVGGISLTEYQNDFTIPSLNINPSPSPQSYFLDIADTVGGPDQSGIFWATSGESTLAFQLFGTGNTPVDGPEPATLLLVGCGVALLACSRVRLAKTRQ